MLQTVPFFFNSCFWTELVEDVSQGVPPLSVLCVPLGPTRGHTLAALRAAARRDEALELWKALEGRNLEKDVALLGVVLSLCDRADLWQEG